MSARKPTRALIGLAAGLTVSALIGATLAVPAANAAPITTAAKFQGAATIDPSRVIKGHYLVETAGKPLVRGGSRSVNTAHLADAKAAATATGATVRTSFSSLWTGLAVTATDEQIKKLAASPSVTAIFPVLRVDLPKNQVSTADASAALSDVAATGVAVTGAGIKVGVLDTGIDYNNVDLGGAGVDNQTADFKKPGGRVMYGYDLVGDAYDGVTVTQATPDAYPDDCEGHGTHVAGIIGAEGTGAGETKTGVAPKVTFGAYRIFGCEGSTGTDIILDAMSRAQADGMDVINMSIGSDFASWPTYPDAQAATNLTNAGVVVVAAAGNSGDTGLFSAGTPAVGAGVISVASYEPATYRSKAITVAGSTIGYTVTEHTGAAPADDVATLTVRTASNTTACTQPATVPAGTAMLVKYSNCSVYNQLDHAFTAGADAVVMYYNHPEQVSYGTSGHVYTKPAIGISGTEGSALAAKIKKSGPQVMTWRSLLPDVPNLEGGRLSTFSSAGLAANLSLVPTITAPGGKIYSTLPIKQGGHGTMSGTSMATPYVVGAVALLLEARPSLKGHPADVAQLLYNTAAPVLSATESGMSKHPEAVFRQGSGLLQVVNALEAGVTASPSVIALGEGTKHSVVITLTNNTPDTQVYTPKRVSSVSAAASTGSATQVGTTTPTYAFGEVGFTTSAKTITLAPGASVPVTITLTAPAKVLKGKAGMLYGGWVQFTTAGSGNSVSVPFAGVRGDYQSVKLLNKFKYVDSDNKKHALPALGVESGIDGSVSFTPSQANNKYKFDLSEIYPSVIYHLDYPASDVRLKVYNVKTKKSYWAIIEYFDLTGTPEQRTHWNGTPRDAAAQVVSFYGDYLDPSTGDIANIADGTYQLQLKVLKPLGTASKSSNWESYSSPKFRIFQ